MTTAVSRSIPPQRLVNGINPVVRALLRSPLHVAVDDSLLLLHVTGRRTGRRYDIPVGYVPVDGGFMVVTQHPWRANLRGSADLDVTHHGRRRRMHADLDEDPGSVAFALRAVIEQIGRQAARRRLGLQIAVDRTPTQPELEAAVQEFHLATVVLTTPQDRALPSS
jgi:hypothetical protein